MIHEYCATQVYVRLLPECSESSIVNLSLVLEDQTRHQQVYWPLIPRKGIQSSHYGKKMDIIQMNLLLL